MTPKTPTDFARLYARLNVGDHPAEMGTFVRADPFNEKWWLTSTPSDLERRIKERVDHAFRIGAMRVAEMVAGHRECLRVWNTEARPFSSVVSMTPEEFDRWYAENFPEEASNEQEGKDQGSSAPSADAGREVGRDSE